MADLQRLVGDQADEPDLTPEQHCGAEDTHGSHRWRDRTAALPDERWCEGFVGRAGVPAAEPRPEGDLLDLVRQHGGQKYMQGLSPMSETRDHGQRAEALFARIGAEVERLSQGLTEAQQARDFLAQQVVKSAREALDVSGVSGGMILADRILTLANERDDARANLGRALQARGEFLDEANRLRAKLQDAAAPQQDGPIALTLPEVPEGAVSVVGVAAPHRRYEPFGDLPFEESPAWRRADDGTLFAGLGGVLDAEPRGVTVEMPPPREPRTWPALDGDDLADLPTLVEVDGTRYRRSGDAAYIQERTGGIWGWWALRGRGDVREVFE